MTNKDIEDMKNQIDELADNLKDRECRNRKLESENEELRKRLEKLESGICGGSPCIVSEFHSFEGESWIRATTYDEVLLRLKKANDRINDLEQKRIERGIETFKGIKAIQKINDELKAENTAFKQHIKDMEDVCDGSCFSDYEDLPFGDDEDERDKLIAKLQDKHKQDFIRLNDMRTAYLVTIYELAELIEQFGVGR